MELLRSWGLEPQVRDAALDVEWRALATPTLAGAATGQPIEVGYPSADQSAVVSPTAPACVPQDELERILEEHLATLPTVRLERGVEIATVESRADGVTVRAVGGRTIRARYLVAADGIRSTVRAALGIPASDSGPLAERLTVLLRGPLWELVGERRHVIYFLDGEVAAVPMSRPDRWVFAFPAPGPADLGAALRQAVGADVDARRRARVAHHLRGRAGRALPRAQRVPDRRRRPPAHPARRDRDEHRDPRRLRPRLEARVGAARMGRRGAARQLRGRAPPGGRAQRRPRHRPERLHPRRRGGAARRPRRPHRPRVAAGRDRAGVDARPARRRADALHRPRLGWPVAAGHAARHRPPARRHHRPRARDPQRRGAAGAARRGAGLSPA